MRDFNFARGRFSFSFFSFNIFCYNFSGNYFSFSTITIKNLFEMGRLLNSMKKGAYGILMIISLLCLQRNGISQEAVRIKRLTSNVEFDGIPGEAVWQTLDLFALTMHKPNYGTQPSEKSDVRIGYDNEFLWVGASLYMKDASKMSRSFLPCLMTKPLGVSIKCGMKGASHAGKVRTCSLRSSLFIVFITFSLFFETVG